MLSLRGQMGTDTRNELCLALESNLDRVNDHKIAGVLRQAMTGHDVLDSHY